MEILKYDMDGIAEILGVKRVTAVVAKKNGQLDDKLYDLGYKIVDTSKQGNKIIYHLVKEREVEISYITKSKYGFMDLSDCEHVGKTTDWKSSLGRHIRGEYKDIKFDFEIVGFVTTEKGALKLKVLHNGIEKEMYGSDAKSFKGFDILLGIKSYDFLYNIGQRIKDEKRDFIITDRKKDRDKNGHMWRYYKIKCNKCGFDCGEHYFAGEYIKEKWIEENSIKCGTGCACCANKICVTGINDMWTTNPKIAKLLANESDGCKYTFRSGAHLDFKCPDCGLVLNKSLANVVKYGKVTCNCSDNITYPEKFTFALLKQLELDFIWQYTKTKAKWAGKYKYDFYFKLDDEEYIIEVHGGQHYNNTFKCSKKTTEDIQSNDLDKYELAITNGIKPENYIVIDFRESTLEWGKLNILNSKLNGIFNLTHVDWNKIAIYACSNVYKDICLEWDGIKNKDSYNILCDKFKCSITMIRTALRMGNSCGWCVY